MKNIRTLITNVYIGKDAEIRESMGVFYYNFSIAEKTFNKKADGELEQKTNWVRCYIVANGNEKEKNKYLQDVIKKGNLISAEAEIKIRPPYEKDGEWFSSFQLFLIRYSIISIKKKDKGTIEIPFSGEEVPTIE